MTIKRILLISRCIPYPIYLGDRLILWHLLHEYKRRGIAVDLIALTQDHVQDERYGASYDHLCASITLVTERRRHPLRYLQRLLLSTTRFPKRASAALTPDLWQQIVQHRQNTQYDAVHVFGGIQVYEVFHALGDQAAVITPYESYALLLQRQIVQQSSFLLRVRAWLARQYEGFMFTPYAAAVVLTALDAATLQGINPAIHTQVIPNGVEIPPEFAVKRDPATLLFLGNLAYAPNVEAVHLLMRAILPLVRAQVPQVHVVIVGNAPPPEVQAYASEAVTVTGYVDDVTPYLHRATLFVCPLVVGAGMKNKVLQAMAHRLPVVATAVSMDGIAVQPEDALVGTVAQLPALIVTALADAAMRTHMADQALAVVREQYSWQHVAEEYLRLYAAIRAD